LHWLPLHLLPPPHTPRMPQPPHTTHPTPGAAPRVPQQFPCPKPPASYILPSCPGRGSASICATCRCRATACHALPALPITAPPASSVSCWVSGCPSPLPWPFRFTSSYPHTAHCTVYSSSCLPSSSSLSDAAWHIWRQTFPAAYAPLCLALSPRRVTYLILVDA